MIQSVAIKNFVGEELTLRLTDPEPYSGLIISKITGLGPAKANINITDISTTDGGIYNSARLEKRNIVMDLLFAFPEGSNLIEDARLFTYKFFPVKKPLSLVIETDRRIVATTGYVESNEPNIFDKHSGTSISIICPDPYFHSFEEEMVTTFSSLTSDFFFPFYGEVGTYADHTTPHTDAKYYLGYFGTLNDSITKEVYYTGDSEIGMRIKIHATGPASNPSIHNLDTQEFMSIDTSKLASLVDDGNENLIAGDDIIISTVRGNKSATLERSGQYYNILNCLDRDVDWLLLYQGVNRFFYEADTGSNNLEISLVNDVIFEGV